MPPEPAPREEREFFGPRFVKGVGDLSLTVSFDVRIGDLYLELFVGIPCANRAIVGWTG